jgi:hypothetical protein
MSDNIHGLFDLSARGASKKKPQKASLPMPPASVKNVPLQNVPQNEDIRAQLEKMKELQSKFTLQIEELCKKTGKDPQTIAKFCQNPSNFSKKQWDELQHKKTELEMKLTGLSQENLETQKKSKAVTAATKERRGKTLGSRKNWLDMH